MSENNKTTLSGCLLQMLKVCIHFVPAIIFMFVYSTVPSIPFVEVSSGAYIFVGILFIAGALLTFKLYWGSIVGIFGCAFAVVGNWIMYGALEMRLVITCAVICMYYIFCIFDIVQKKRD